MLQLASLASFTHQSLLRADTTHYPRENIVVFLNSAGLVNCIESMERSDKHQSKQHKGMKELEGGEA